MINLGKFSQPNPAVSNPPELDEKSSPLGPIPSKGLLLRELFREIHRADLVYAVLRNYDGLPEKPGRDVDILTNNFEQFKEIIEQVSRRTGYSVRIFRRYDSLVKFHLISETSEGFEVLEIDVAWDISWKGVSLMPKELLERYRVWHKEFYTLRPGLEAAVSLTKNLIYDGSVQEKYKPQLPEMVRTDRDGFLKVLTPCFGAKISSGLADLASRGEWPSIETLVPQLRRQALLRALSPNPLAQVGRWVSFLGWNVWKFCRPGGLFVVLMGPDGSGKSTVAAGLQQSLAPLFQGTRYYHAYFRNIPRLRDLAQSMGFKVPEEIPPDQPAPAKKPKEVPRPERLKSLFSLLYYALDYILGYPVIFRVRGQGKLIVFDRYYYDYLVQPGRALPPWFMTLVLQMLPQPDVVVYLRNNPDVILSRKPELTREELERQGAICAQLISQQRHGFTVETTGSPQDSIAKVSRILVSKMINLRRSSSLGAIS